MGKNVLHIYRAKKGKQNIINEGKSRLITLTKSRKI